MAKLSDGQQITTIDTQKVILTNADGQVFTIDIIDLERALGIEYTVIELPPITEKQIPIKGGLYIAKNDINPETVIFSVEEFGGRITKIVGAKDGSIDFWESGSYVRVSISDDRKYVVFKNVHKSIYTKIRLKRVCLS